MRACVRACVCACVCVYVLLEAFLTFHGGRHISTMLRYIHNLDGLAHFRIIMVYSLQYVASVNTHWLHNHIAIPFRCGRRCLSYEVCECVHVTSEAIRRTLTQRVHLDVMER